MSWIGNVIGGLLESTEIDESTSDDFPWISPDGNTKVAIKNEGSHYSATIARRRGGKVYYERITSPTANGAAALAASILKQPVRD